MDRMYETLSDNLVRLRKSRNLTQAEFADILKYSDKSVSKWETGEALPNLETLLAISDFYGISIDNLLRKSIDTEQVVEVEKVRTTNKLVISILMVTAVWFIAVVIFVFGLMKDPPDNRWMAFIWAVPSSAIIGLVSTSFWDKKYVPLFISLLIWTILTSLYLQSIVLGHNYWMIFLIGVPLQIIVFLSRGLRYDVAEESVQKAAKQKEKILAKQVKQNNSNKEKTL